MTETEHANLPAESIRSRTGRELRAVALAQFASVGFAATSLQHIADAAGFSKSSVLYHFASKEAILTEVLTPAIDHLEKILDRFVAEPDSVESRKYFVGDFIDFVLHYRFELHTFINQGQSLVGIEVVDRARALVVRLAASICDEQASVEDRLRFGIALGGAAYTLVAGMTYLDDDLAADDDLRPALVTVLTELLAPVSHTLSRKQP
ncbi:TetR/AcrR family transcriptional regulator [Cryobacterium melibiosiphilum]|uniref:TetR/AcrR family transcriptional regulator n=1 Tax=Cryobacterium melibiosiphilum TaxID=995039 RepID=A0A3A5M9J8_9MICO|nr:TetR/AcrR family transcriptional regulator [Cryobacterium melibiosiphilum]RJT84790.1 TetR/AcrR family transcriptional regulator [Cryobacterium melibiosiphilum]